MKIGIGIFAKTIGLTPVKTRLAKVIGSKKAEAFFALSLDVVEETMTSLVSVNSAINPYWVLAEEAGPLNERWEEFPGAAF